MSKVYLKFVGLTFIGLLFFTNISTAQNFIANGNDAEEVTSGYQFTEGPYWHPDGYLLFSDIPANTIYKWTPGSKESQVFMNPSGHSNGIAADPKGNLILAQHDGMVSMVNSDKKVVVLAQSYNGKRLNSPNDLTVSSDGTIYFTDPPFGVSKEQRELSMSGVYMIRPGTKKLQLLYNGFDQPNGIVLSPDESKLYVNNSSSGEIRIFDIGENGNVKNGQPFASVGAASDSGAADGITVDQSGRVYSTGPGGIFIFSREGKQLQKIDLPARVTNLGWGGANNSTLYLTTPSAVYRLPMKTQGVQK